MDRLEILDRAAAGFALALAQVEPDQWDAPTGNEGRTVRGLVDHVVGGDHMATVLLHGGTRAEASAQFVASADGTDLVVAFDEARRELAEAFGAEGVLELIVPHPAMDMPGAQLLFFRTTEYALHGWDLARAVGADDAIDPAVLEELNEGLSAMGPLLAMSGMFGTGASADLSEDAPLQVRVLDLSGRRS